MCEQEYWLYSCGCKKMEKFRQCRERRGIVNDRRGGDTDTGFSRTRLRRIGLESINRLQNELEPVQYCVLAVEQEI